KTNTPPPNRSEEPPAAEEWVDRRRSLGRQDQFHATVISSTDRAPLGMKSLPKQAIEAKNLDFMAGYDPKHGETRISF
ncbi:hypothetical protein, partial [Brevundimonas sp.]|uniref:hypothetical protein n=1 Tax=Brevundimonas sp. TaxID=1871086 RepID=UPI002897C5C4